MGASLPCLTPGRGIISLLYPGAGHHFLTSLVGVLFIWIPHSWGNTFQFLNSLKSGENYSQFSNFYCLTNWIIMFCFIAIFVPYGIFPPWNTRVPSFPMGECSLCRIIPKKNCKPKLYFWLSWKLFWWCHHFSIPLGNILFLRIFDQNTTTFQLVMHDILLLAVLYKNTSEN